MLNKRSLTAVAASKIGPGWVKPAYGSYCFAGIPDTLRQAYGLTARSPLPADVLPDGAAFDRVIFFFVDAFGWRFFEHYADAPFLKAALDGGVVSQLTSMFPSTTATHVTCIHTGLDVAASGVVEWFYYDPTLDAIIAPLLYSYAGDKDRETLARDGADPRRLFPSHTLYQEFAQAGVKSYVFGHRDYAQSSYSRVIMAGAQSMPYRTWPEALTNLTLLLEQERERSYYFLYFGEVDGQGHEYGPGSRQFGAEADCWLTLMAGFLDECRRNHPRTLILVTADHGMAETEPATTQYLNSRLPGFERYLKTDRRGRPLLFGGSPRDLLLYVRDDYLAEVEALLARELAGRAEVWRTSELIRRGVLGAPAAEEPLIERIGNLIVLPHRYEAVSWYEKDRFEQRYYGHHGGLTPEEMLIPFIAYVT